MKLKKDLARRLVAAQIGLPSVARDSEGSTGGRNYNYASLSSVMDAVRDPLQEQGLFIVHRTATDLAACEVTVWTSVVSVEGDALTVKIVLPYPREAGNLAQAIGSALTYARRYGVLVVLGLATADDDGATLTRHASPSGGRVSMNPYGDDAAHEEERVRAELAAREPREDGRDLVTLETWDALLQAGRGLNEAQRAAMQEWREDLGEPFGLHVSAEDTVQEALARVRVLKAGIAADLDDESPEDLGPTADELARQAILDAADAEEAAEQAAAGEHPTEEAIAAEATTEPTPEDEEKPKRSRARR